MNPIRTCPICSGTDDHPRHVFDAAGTTVALHMDCCATSRNCEVCTAQLDGVGGVKGNPKGDALRKHLRSTGPAADQAGWTALVDETVKGN